MCRLLKKSCTFVYVCIIIKCETYTFDLRRNVMETYGIEKLGIIGPKAVYRNLTPAQLTEAALRRGEGSLSETGALVVTTGKYTGRSPKDKFIVDTDGVHNEIAWGKVNRPISREQFNSIKGKITAYLEGREVFIFDGFAGADKKYTQKFRVVNELASQNLFIHQLLIRPTAEELKDYLAQEHHLLIRDASNFRGLTPHHFRVASQTPAENDALVDAIKQFITLKNG